MLMFDESAITVFDPFYMLSAFRLLRCDSLIPKIRTVISKRPQEMKGASMFLGAECQRPPPIPMPHPSSI